MKNPLLLFFAIIILAGCTQTQTQTTQQPTTNKEVTPPQEPNTIIIKDFAFNPATLRVPVGTSVTWRNRDSAPHAISGDGFMSSTLNTGETFMHMFTQKGTYPYVCSIHPSMKGTIIAE